jgi:hypothetical protein
LVLADTLLEVFEPELQLVRAQLLRPTAELMTAQLLDQQPQLVVLGAQLALLVQHRPQHLLQRGGVVWQGFWVDLHGQMMAGAAASQPAFSDVVSPQIQGGAPVLEPATHTRRAGPPAAALSTLSGLSTSPMAKRTGPVPAAWSACIARCHHAISA